MLKQIIHHPPHLYFDDTWYFLTARVYERQSLLNDNTKQLLLNKIKAEFEKFSYSLIAWVILNNHYHLEFKTKNAGNLPKIMNQIHGYVSFMINKLEKKEGRKIFQNYWDHCVRDEKSFWRHFNYIHHNPIKHNYTAKMEDYRFSSYRIWLKKKGEDWLASCFEFYPIIDFTTEDNF